MKKNNTFLFLISFFIVLTTFACKNRYQSQVLEDSTDPLKDVFIEANKQLIANEENKIDSLLHFLDFSFVKHVTGIRIFTNNVDGLVDNKKTIYPKDGDGVTVAYNCVVFDDHDVILDNTFVDTLSFQIGYSKQMRGLNYAIKLLKVGDKAKIIIPSYLGFGMSGYGKVVPPYSTLFLNVKLLNIKE